MRSPSLPAMTYQSLSPMARTSGRCGISGNGIDRPNRAAVTALTTDRKRTVEPQVGHEGRSRSSSTSAVTTRVPHPLQVYANDCSVKVPPLWSRKFGLNHAIALKVEDEDARPNVECPA